MKLKAEVLPILFILAAAFITLYAVAALADTLSFTWDDPLTREDGTPITKEEIAGYHAKLNTIESLDLIIGNSLTMTVPIGEHCLELQTEDTDGRLSVFTLPVCKKAKGPPGKPGNVTGKIKR